MLQILYDLCHETFNWFHSQAHKNLAQCEPQFCKGTDQDAIHSVRGAALAWLPQVLLAAFAKALCFFLFLPEKKPFGMFNQDDTTNCNIILWLPGKISFKSFYRNLIYHKLGKRMKKRFIWIEERHKELINILWIKDLIVLEGIKQER